MRCVVDKENIQDLLNGFPIEFNVNGDYVLFGIEKDIIQDIEYKKYASWIFDSDQWEYYCTHCHGWIGNVRTYNRCPYCGAYMTIDNNK